LSFIVGIYSIDSRNRHDFPSCGISVRSDGAPPGETRAGAVKQRNRVWQSDPPRLGFTPAKRNQLDIKISAT
jgi:hypothetical protein